MRPFVRGSWRRGAIVSGALLCATAHMTPARDAHYAADTVRVEAQRPPLDAPTTSPHFVTVLPAHTTADAVSHLPDMLGHSVGVSVRQYGAPGAFSAVSVRGSSSAQVDVYVDGIPLARARDGLARLGSVSLASLSRVEVARGWSPVAYGSAPLGGSINLVPLDLRASETSLRVAAGSFGTWDASVAHGAASRDGARRLTLHADGFRTSGAYRYLDDNGTPLTPIDDAIVQRINHDVLHVTAGAVAHSALARAWSIDALLDASARSSGIPGTGAVQAEHARLEQQRALAHVRARWAGSRAAFVEAGVYDVAMREQFADRTGELGGGNQDNDDRTAETGARVRGVARVGDDETEWAVERTLERWRAIDRWPRTVVHPLVTRTTDRASVEHRVHLLSRRVTIAPSYRAEWVRAQARGALRIGAAPPVPASALQRRARAESPALGVRIALHRTLECKGHTGRYHREPSAIELFGERGTIMGNARLAPERGTHSDLGAQFHTRSVRLEAVAFRVRAHDLITLVQNSQRTSVPQNVSAARIDGVEWSATAEIDARVSAEANLTLETARDAGASIYTRGKLLPGRPLREAFAAITVRTRRADWRGEVSAASGSYLDRANRVPVRARCILTAGANARLGRGTTLTLTVKNIFDTHVSDVAGYPLPGRAVYLALAKGPHS